MVVYRSGRFIPFVCSRKKASVMGAPMTAVKLRLVGTAAPLGIAL